ncbi:hypothetical protein QA447_14345 [Pseudomonas sp. abacavir_1]
MSNDLEKNAALAQPSQAPDLEWPEVVAFLMKPDTYEPYVGLRRDSSCDYVEPLMTVAQHERLTQQMRYKAELYDEVWALATGKGYMNVTTAISVLERERDAAQEKLAELEGQSGIEFVYDSDELVAVPRGLLGAACHAIDKKRDAPRTIAKLREYARGLPAPVAQAGQAPEEWRDMLAELQWHYEPYDDHYHKDMGYYCPRCGGEQDAGHKQYCDLAKLLAAASQPGAQFTEQHQTLTKSEQIAESANHQPAKGDAAEDQLCSFCFRRGCNGECSGDGAMGD